MFITWTFRVLLRNVAKIGHRQTRNKKHLTESDHFTLNSTVMDFYKSDRNKFQLKKQ
jgi:hypothetical protein